MKELYGLNQAHRLRMMLQHPCFLSPRAYAVIQIEAAHVKTLALQAPCLLALA